MFKKRWCFATVAMLILIFGVFNVNAAVDKTKAWEDASRIKILIDGSEKSLQQAINEELLFGAHTYAQFSSNPSGHNTDEIWAFINGTRKSLISILSTTGICGISKNVSTKSCSTLLSSCNTNPNSKPCCPGLSCTAGMCLRDRRSTLGESCGGTTNYNTKCISGLTCTRIANNPYGSAIKFCQDAAKSSHNAMEIEVTLKDGSKMDLQEAINGQRLCPPITYSWNATAWACAAPCGPSTLTRTIFCQKKDHDILSTEPDQSKCTGAQPSATGAACQLRNCQPEYDTYSASSCYGSQCGNYQNCDGNSHYGVRCYQETCTYGWGQCGYAYNKCCIADCFCK